MRIRSLSVLLVSIAFAGCAVVKPVNLPVAAKQPPNIQPKKPVQVALVLGSGGVRGVAEAGVIKVLAAAGVPIDAIIGTSAGSIVGALYASDPDPARLSKLMLGSDRSQVVRFNIFDVDEGLVSGYTLQRYLIKNMPSGIYFKDLKIPFGVMTTNFVTGDAHFINSGVIPPAVNASAAIPGVFRIVHLYGMKFVDGGISASLGTKQARKFYKPKLLIAVSIHNDLEPNIPSSMLDKMNRALDIVETNLETEQFRYADIVLHPRVGDVGTLDSGQNQNLYNAGVIVAKRYLPKILRMMRERGIARVKPK